jgi:hypothetical protein
MKRLVNCDERRHALRDDTQFAGPLRNFVDAAGAYISANSVEPERIAAAIADACTHRVRGAKLRPNMSWSMTALKYLPQGVMDVVVRHMLARRNTSGGGDNDAGQQQQRQH